MSRSIIVSTIGRELRSDYTYGLRPDWMVEHIGGEKYVHTWCLFGCVGQGNRDGHAVLGLRHALHNRVLGQIVEVTE